MIPVSNIKYTLRHRVVNRSKFCIQYPKYRVRNGDSLPNFYNTITVKPERISKFVYPGFYTDSRTPRFEDGEWDRRVRDGCLQSSLSIGERSIFQIQEYSLYQSIYNRYINQSDWEDTEYYSIAVETIESGGCWKGCNTERDLMSYLCELDSLYCEMKQNGYKSSKELGKHISHEVTVSIGRDGDIFMDDGRHRLFMAKIIGIEEIPVWALVRHEKWQKTRRRLKESPLSVSEYQIDHPDLNDIQ